MSKRNFGKSKRKHSKHSSKRISVKSHMRTTKSGKRVEVKGYERNSDAAGIASAAGAGAEFMKRKQYVTPTTGVSKVKKPYAEAGAEDAMTEYIRAQRKYAREGWSTEAQRRMRNFKSVVSDVPKKQKKQKTSGILNRLKKFYDSLD